MAQQITFIVMAYPPQHTAKNANGKYKRGDIIDAKLTSEVPEPPHSNSRFVFVDVIDVPNKAARKIRDFLNTDDRDAETKIINRRTWYLDRDLIPTQRLAKLIQTRRGTATWSEFKAIVKRRTNEANITDNDLR